MVAVGDFQPFCLFDVLVFGVPQHLHGHVGVQAGGHVGGLELEDLFVGIADPLDEIDGFPGVEPQDGGDIGRPVLYHEGGNLCAYLNALFLHDLGETLDGAGVQGDRRVADKGSHTSHPGEKPLGHQVVRGLADSDPGYLIGVGQFQLCGNQVVFFVVTEIYFLKQVIFDLFVLRDSFLCHGIEKSLLS